MNDWVRSLALLAMAFAAVVVLTIGLSVLIVADPAPVAGGAAGESQPPAGPTAAPGGIPGIGGTLTVTGDYTGSVVLSRESIGEIYSLTGGDARIVFGGGSPATVDQISFDGWQFFPDPEQCTLTAGNLEGLIGIGFGELRCDDLEEIRNKGTVSMAGEIGMPIDRLAPRTLPHSGGTLTVGNETWTIGQSFLATWQQPAIAGVSDYNLVLGVETDADRAPDGPALNFYYDIETHRLSAVTIHRGGEQSDIAEGACALERTELGKQNPRTTVIELEITCAEIEVPGLGLVPVTGTVVVDELAWPE